MANLLDRLLEGSPAYRVTRETGGYTLVARPDGRAEFSALVRQAADAAGDDFVVFPTPDGARGYSRMFVMPLDGMDAPPD